MNRRFGIVYFTRVLFCVQNTLDSCVPMFMGLCNETQGLSICQFHVQLNNLFLIQDSLKHYEQIISLDQMRLFMLSIC